MHNSHRRSIETFSPVSRLGTRPCTTDPNPAIPSAVALGQKGKISLYGFSVGLTLRQVGTRVPLSPSLGLSQRAETTLLNKSVEISTTTGRFCSRCHLYNSAKNKSRLSFRTSGSLSVNHCILSGQSAARAKAPGPRYPLDPVLLRHKQISHSAS